MMDENNIDENSSLVTGIWSERVLVITKDYQIKGNVFMPKTGNFLDKNKILVRETQKIDYFGSR